MTSRAPSETGSVSFFAKPTDTDDRLYFAAAAVTFGFALAPGTPGIDNVYDRAKRYERGQPGDVKLYFAPATPGGISLAALSHVWEDWQEDLDDAANLPARIIAARTSEEWEACAALVDLLHVSNAVAHMRLFSLRRFGLPTPPPATPEEITAAEMLDGLAARMRKNPNPGGTVRQKTAVELARAWSPAMVCWVKAWCVNLREIRDAWRHSIPAVKIERPDRPAPLVIPKGKNFEKCLKKWT